MSVKRSFIIITLLVLLAGFISPVKKGFQILGEAKGFADSTVIYLDDVVQGTYRHLDSTYIIKEKFYFEGNISGKYLRAFLRTADLQHKCFLWLENAEIKVETVKGEFNKAIIFGSKIQEEQNVLNAIIRNSKDPDKEEQNYVRNNPNTFLSAYLLNFYTASWGKETTEKLFASFPKKNKKNEFGKSIAEFLRLNKSPKIGEAFINFSQKDTSGKMVKIGQFKGKVFLLEFWGSWCGPCREENPGLIKIYNEFKNKGFEIIGVATESKRELWLQAIKEDKLNWINISDVSGDKNKASIIYGVSYYPTNILVNKEGIIVGKDLYGDELTEKLKELL